MKSLTRSMAASVLMLGMTLFSQGQAGLPSSQVDRAPFPPASGRERERDESATHMEQQQVRSRNSERQKRLVDDTNRLLSLATELKTQVDKTDKDMLSVDVIKKADEIEKLARSVKDRMKG